MIRIILIYYFSFIKLFLLSSSLSYQNLNANLGDDITLSCIFDNQYQLNEISFMHQTTGDLLSVGLELFVDESLINKKIQLIQFSSNRLDLKVNSVNQNDSGLYSCMINHLQLNQFFIKIFIPPRFVSYFPLEANLLYPEGSSINFSCHAYSIPSVNITWIYTDYYKQSKTIHIGESMYISSIESSDSGSYECLASNGYHSSISRSFYITVQYGPRILLNKLIENNNTTKSTIELICEICSFPISNIQWIKNKKFIKNNRHFIIKTKQRLIQNQQCLITTLTIYELSNDKYGRYVCKAENILGHNSAHIDYYPRKISKHKSENEKMSVLTIKDDSNFISNSKGYISQPKLILILLIKILTNFFFKL